MEREIFQIRPTIAEIFDLVDLPVEIEPSFKLRKKLRQPGVEGNAMCCDFPDVREIFEDLEIEILGEGAGPDYADLNDITLLADAAEIRREIVLQARSRLHPRPRWKIRCNHVHR